MTNLPAKLAFVDVETTGLRPTYDRIIELGILRVEDGKITKTLNTLVDPGLYLPPEIVVLTGINSTDLDKSPSFRDLLDLVEEILEGATFVAHNARFDYAFIKNEFKRYGVKFSAKQICTAKLSRQVLPALGRYNLDKIISTLGFECEVRHRAYNDAKVLWDLWQYLEKGYSESFSQSINALLKRPSIPAKLSPEIIKNLPHKSGIYIFYGEGGYPLYVGKSTDIKKRVLSHFTADHASSLEMKITQNVQSIDFVVTSGELGALILESQTIKKLQPLYNRKLRHSYEMVVLKKKQNSDGYLELEFERLSSISVSELENIVGIFRSLKQAKSSLIYLSKEYNLCDKLLGLESSKGGCFNQRLGRCFGACLKKEIYQKYNLRFLEAFTRSRIRSWPFEGSVLIEEGDDDKRETFVVNNWCLVGEGETHKFDLDIYKILNSYLKSPKNVNRVKRYSAPSEIDDQNYFQFPGKL